MSKRLALTVTLGIWLGTALAQSQSDLKGRWIVENVSIEGGAKAELSDGNCTWCGHYKNNVPLEVDNDGKVNYMYDGLPHSAKFTLKGNQLKVNFFDSPDLPSDGSVESYTLYEYRSSSNGFVIKRSDPMVSETYEFKKLN